MLILKTVGVSGIERWVRASTLRAEHGLSGTGGADLEAAALVGETIEEVESSLSLGLGDSSCSGIESMQCVCKMWF